MERSPSPPARSRQAGSSYVVVLVVVAVLSTFALTFVTQTGVRVSAGADRTESAQAAYLAEAAVHHAMWRLLHEPGFPADETVYSMHSLGTGRYGYRVRAPTPTTLATISTVGVMGGAIVRQAWSQHVLSRILTAYGQSTDRTPGYRRLVGASWGGPADMPDVGASAVWVELAGDPRDDEVVAVTIGADDVTRLAVWDGAAWGSPLTVAIGRRENRSADVAYESGGGDALCVAWDGSPGQLRYLVWNGTAWSAPATVGTGEASDVTFVRLASSPKSDEILVVAVHANDDVALLRWDGASLAFVSELETEVAKNGPFGAEVLYEGSGRALVVWGRKGQPSGAFAIWTGAALMSGGLLPSFGAAALLLRGASDPTSDELVLAAADEVAKLHVAVWDGSAWIDSRAVETSADQPTLSEPNFDVAWESFGEEAVVAWAKSGSTTLRFLPWLKDSTLASRTVRTGPDFGAPIRGLRAFAVDGTEDVVVLGSTTASQLRYARWTGNAFAAGTRTLETAVSVTTGLPFGVARSAS